MVNEEKVILMTNMASFEKHQGRKCMNIVNYYRSDYIGFQVLKAVIAATISFLALLSVYFFYNFEMIMSDIYNMDLVAFGKQLIMIYLITVGIYALICYGVYAYRYSKAKKELKGFYQNLRKIDKMESQV